MRGVVLGMDYSNIKGEYLNGVYNLESFKTVMIISSVAFFIGLLLTIFGGRKS